MGRHQADEPDNARECKTPGRRKRCDGKTSETDAPGIDTETFCDIIPGNERIEVPRASFQKEDADNTDWGEDENCTPACTPTPPISQTTSSRRRSLLEIYFRARTPAVKGSR
jgi:hypothetical protein